MLLCGLTGILGKGEALGAPVGCSKRWREYWGKCGVGRQGKEKTLEKGCQEMIQAAGGGKHWKAVGA